MNSTQYFLLGILIGFITMVVIITVVFIRLELSNLYFKGYVSGLKDAAEDIKTISEEPNASHIIRAYQDGTKDVFDAPHFGSGLNYYIETYKKQ
jgi:hypothetical protein